MDNVVRIEIGSDVTGRVCIVIDVLRASSTIVTLLERGCERVVVATDVAEARRLHERLPDHMLCGEAGGLPPKGFDYGNSPVEFSRMNLAGQSVILATTNGTRALARAADEAAAVLVGCLLNRRAVAEAAVRLAAEQDTGITVVPAGDSSSSAEDEAAASAIVDAARGDHGDGRDAARVVATSKHADELRSIGLGEDVKYCAQVDVSEVVPMLQPGEDGLPVLRKIEGR